MFTSCSLFPTKVSKNFIFLDRIKIPKEIYGFQKAQTKNVITASKKYGGGNYLRKCSVSQIPSQKKRCIQITHPLVPDKQSSPQNTLLTIQSRVTANSI